MESVLLKVFTVCLRDSVFSFLNQTKFIEAEIQKDFTRKVAGVLEHTSMMSNIIDKVRKSQRSVVITLLDLKNAFGAVRHNLIQKVLLYHHISDKTQALISSLYDGFHTAVITDHYSTPAVPVRHGVLQGDCLGLLLLTCASKLSFNSFAKNNTNNLAPLRIINSIAFSNRYTGFNLQMMLLLSQQMSARINS